MRLVPGAIAVAHPKAANDAWARDALASPVRRWHTPLKKTGSRFRMGMIAFDRDSGVEVFPAEALTSFSSVKSAAALDEALASYLRCLGLTYNVLDLRFDPSTGIVHLGGIVEHHEHRERIALCCGNVRGVGGVDDAMNVIMPSEVSRWRFVQPGDTFESIAKAAYRDPTRANALRAANQPLIGDSDVLPAGWLLRIPAVEHLSRD